MGRWVRGDVPIIVHGRSRMTIRPSHPYNARGTEHVGFPPTRQAVATTPSGRLAHHAPMKPYRSTSNTPIFHQATFTITALYSQTTAGSITTLPHPTKPYHETPIPAATAVGTDQSETKDKDQKKEENKIKKTRNTYIQSHEWRIGANDTVHKNANLGMCNSTRPSSTPSVCPKYRS